MNRAKGIAVCGLACCVCSENQTCAGCRNDGCTNKDWCKAFLCGKKKQIDGCYKCPDYDSCDFLMLKKPKISAFNQFLQQYGTEKLMDCLAENEKLGVVYHNPGTVIGDYDTLASTEQIIELLLQGDKKK